MNPDFIIGSIAGMLIGGFCGFISAAICIVAGRCDGSNKN